LSAVDCSDLKLKRAFCLLVCGGFGLLFALIGMPPASADQDLGPVYANAATCTIIGIAAGFILARLSSHLRVWEIVVAAILVLLIVAQSLPQPAVR
jgi:hypothetical protein